MTKEEYLIAEVEFFRKWYKHTQRGFRSIEDTPIEIIPSITNTLGYKLDFAMYCFRRIFES